MGAKTVLQNRLASREPAICQLVNLGIRQVHSLLNLSRHRSGLREGSALSRRVAVGVVGMGTVAVRAVAVRAVAVRGVHMDVA